ncbi:MAG: hypothetical protein M3O26_19440 [Pseudomonadota bacterium]|nr:hypothetical protein [Pseudomonadota bacterium]
MNDDIESKLRGALRPVEPRADFSRRLLARMRSAEAAPPKPKLRPGARPLVWWFTASLAACLIMAIGIQQHLYQQRLQETGLEARREVQQALRVTSQKLNLAFEAIKSQSTAPRDEKSGV